MLLEGPDVNSKPLRVGIQEKEEEKATFDDLFPS